MRRAKATLTQLPAADGRRGRGRRGAWFETEARFSPYTVEDSDPCIWAARCLAAVAVGNLNHGIAARIKIFANSSLCICCHHLQRILAASADARLCQVRFSYCSECRSLAQRQAHCGIIGVGH